VAQIEVTREVMEGLAREARSALPAEACGILLGTQDRIERIVPARNVHATPHTQFEIDPQALVDAFRAERQGGPRVVGYYHSHPHGPAEPSAIDRELASRDGRVWAIAGGDDVRFWRDDAAGFVELSTRLATR
jgi:proteasome lid subunit RPN8/RPN11